MKTFKGRVCTNSKVTREAIALLEGTGLPFTLENGGAHLKVHLAGKPIAVMCKNGGRGRDTAMIRQAIRRRLKELQCS